MRLETPRLVIRNFEPRDRDAWVAIYGDPRVRRYLPALPAPTLEMFWAALDKHHRLERARGYTMCAVELKSTGALIGRCGLSPVEGTGPDVELAYYYSPDSWGCGYATEAAIAVLRYGFEVVGLDRIIALVMQENLASQRVVEKCGMRFEGVATYYGVADLKKYVALRGSWAVPELRDS
jgi:ribosomal-protein-alanine N-acetyltransferase